MPYFEPVILFFRLGAIAGFVRSDLKIPGVLYESFSIFLLLAIGLKGGVELARYRLLDVALPALFVVAAGALVPLVALPVRDATRAPHANICLEVLCVADTSRAICTALRERYDDNDSMVMYAGDVHVLHPEKF